MKVFNLRCEDDHRFEGWFASLEDFESQLDRKLTRCPVCDSADLTRMPSAPRLNLAQSSVEAPAAPEALQARWIRAVREFLANTEDLGTDFANEARRIHYREAPERTIRGIASPEEHDALLEEGIEVFPLAVPLAAKEPLQ